MANRSLKLIASSAIRILLISLAVIFMLNEQLITNQQLTVAASSTTSHFKQSIDENEFAYGEQPQVPRATTAILLDTTEQSSLGWTRYPDGGPGGQGRTPGWSEETFLQVERDINWRSFVTCDVAYNSVNNWLWTPYLERGDASRLYIEIKFTMRDCSLFPQMVLSCKETFALLYKEVDGPMVTSGSSSASSAANVSFAQSDSFTLIDAIAADQGRFSSNSDVVINTEIRSVPVSKRGVYFAFRDQGACLSLISIKVYSLKCPTLVTNLARFNSTPTGREQTSLVPVEGECVANSVQIEPPKMFCASDGQWNSMTSGTCKCLAGYEPAANNTKCQACPMGRFKASLGDSPCLPCPEHSSSGAGQLAATECKCHDGYFRSAKDSRSAPCTQPPASGPVNLSATYVDSTSVVLQWAPPTRTGNRDDLTYTLKCDSCDLVSLVSSPQFIHSFSETKCVLAGLTPNTHYRFSIYVTNGVTPLVAQHQQQIPYSEISVHTAAAAAQANNKRANEPLSSQNGGFQFLPITNFRALPGARGHDILLAWDATSAGPLDQMVGQQQQQQQLELSNEMVSLYEVKFQPRFPTSGSALDSPARRSPYPLLYSNTPEHTPPSAAAPTQTPTQSISTTNRAIGVYSLQPRTEYAFQIRAKFQASNQWTDWSEPIYATSGHGPAHSTGLIVPQFVPSNAGEDLLIQFDPMRNIFANPQPNFPPQPIFPPQQQQPAQQTTSGWLGSLVIILLCSLVVSLLLIATLVHYRHSVCLKSLSPLLSGNLMGGVSGGGSSNVGSTYAGVYNGGTSSDLIGGGLGASVGGGLYGPTVTQIYHNGAGGLTLHAHHMGQHHAHQHHLHSGSAGALITGSNSTSRSSSTGTGNVVQNFLAATLGQLAGSNHHHHQHQQQNYHNNHHLSKTLSQQQHEQGKLFLQAGNNQQANGNAVTNNNNNNSEQHQRQHLAVEQQARNHYHQMLGNVNHTLLLSGSHGQYQPTSQTASTTQVVQCNGAADLFNHQQQSKYDNSRTLSGQQQQQQQLYGLSADPQLHIYDDLEVVAGGDCSPPTPGSKQQFSSRANETLLQERLKSQLYAREVYENPIVSAASPANNKSTLVIGNGPNTTIVQPLAATRTQVTQQQQTGRLFPRRDDRHSKEEFYDD